MVDAEKLVDISFSILALLSVGLLLYELDHPEAMPITFSIDFCIAMVFLVEYIFSTIKASRKLKYALSHWYDLLSSLPVPFSAVRMFRTLRLIRMIRLLRLLKVSRTFSFLEESGVGRISIIFLMIILFGLSASTS